MVDIIGASSAANFALAGKSIARDLSTLFPSDKPIGTKTLTLAGGAAASIYDAPELRLNLRDTRVALKLALTTSQAVAATLRALRSTVDLALKDGLVSPDTSLTFKGSRLSRVNLSSQSKIALERVDALIKNSGFAGANFISSSGRSVRVTINSFGGKLTINPQPLDSKGLGLDNFSLIFENDLNETDTALNNAISLADVRIERLRTIQNALDGNDPFGASITRTLAGSRASELPSGSLVNLIA